MHCMKQVPVTLVSQALQTAHSGEPFVVTRRGKPVALTVVTRKPSPGSKRVHAAFARLRHIAEQTPVCSYSKGITAQIRRDRDHDRL